MMTSSATLVSLGAFLQGFRHAHRACCAMTMAGLGSKAQLYYQPVERTSYQAPYRPFKSHIHDVTCAGTVMVLCTPDAQRSFLSFFDSSAVRLTASMRRAISSARLVVIEGYMLELPGGCCPGMGSFFPGCGRL